MATGTRHLLQYTERFCSSVVNARVRFLHTIILAQQSSTGWLPCIRDWWPNILSCLWSTSLLVPISSRRTCTGCPCPTQAERRVCHQHPPARTAFAHYVGVLAIRTAVLRTASYTYLGTTRKRTSPSADSYNWGKLCSELHTGYEQEQQTMLCEQHRARE